MSRGIELQVDGFYHVFNRGTERRKTFSTKADYTRFIALLYLANSDAPVHISNYQGSTLIDGRRHGKPLVDICAYCLMPNHFHLLLHEHTKGGISRFMQKLITAYTMYFNKRNERTGALFQGKFKARDANDDGYLKYLISYIHLNPIKLIEPKWTETGIHNRVRAEKFLDEYAYSSYADYSGQKRSEAAILTMDALPGYFESPSNFKQDVTEWLEYHQSLDSIKVEP